MSKRQNRNQSRAAAKRKGAAAGMLSGVSEVAATRWLDKEAWLLGLVLVLTVLAYANSLSSEFVYDDWYQVERNPAVKSWTSLSTIFTRHVWEFANTENMPVSGLYYRPIFNLALLVNYQLFGLSVLGWHLVSLLIHAGTTAMVYRLGRLWNFGKIAAALAALIFGLHPIHVEAVAWASALPDLMLGFFVMGALILWEKFREAPRFRGLYFLGSVACACLAVGAKETGIALPLFLIARELFDKAPAAGTTSKIRRAALWTVPFAAVAVVYLAMRYSILGFIAKTNEYSLWQMILTVPFVVLQYLRTLVAPYGLAFIYDYAFVSSATDPRFWASALLLAVAAGSAARYSVSRPGAMKALLLFAIFLLPALNLRALTPIESIAHDRYLYLPSAGFFLAVAFGIDELVSRLSRNRETLLVAVAAVLALLLIPLTFFQNRTWRNDTVLTEHALRISPQWPFLHLHLAEVYEEKGREAEAESELKKVLAFAPGWASGYATLGNFYSKRGRAEEAERLFLEATRLGTNVLSTRVNLAVNQIRLGRLPEAKVILERLLAERPDNAAINFNLGLVHEKQERLDLAEQHYQKAISKDPAYVDPRINLAAVLVRQMRFDQAFQQIETVRSLAPQNTEILYSLAGAYLQSQKCDLAVETLNQLSRAQPTQPRVYVMLGLGYECLRHPEEAKASFQRAIAVAPNDPINAVARRHLEQLGASP